MTRDSSGTTHEEQNGYRTTLHQAPTIPVQIGGVPRDLAILWWSLIMAALIAGLMWQALPLGIVVHAVLKRITKTDVYWMHVLRRCMRQKAYYHARG
jgi:type IV secretory pathway TrbD component